MKNPPGDSVEFRPGIWIRQSTVGGEKRIRVSLTNELGEELDSWTMEDDVYMSLAYINPIIVSPDKKSFIIYTHGNTGFEETITYAYAFEVTENNRLIMVKSLEDYGGRHFNLRPVFKKIDGEWQLDFDSKFYGSPSQRP